MGQSSGESALRYMVFRLPSGQLVFLFYLLSLDNRCFLGFLKVFYYSEQNAITSSIDPRILTAETSLPRVSTRLCAPAKK